MEQVELLRHAIDLLDRLGVPYMLVGSLASGVWGEDVKRWAGELGASEIWEAMLARLRP